MNLTSAKVGDLILADVKGRRFYAEIRKRENGTLNVMPLDNRISYRTVTARQVKGLWHKSRRRSQAKTAREVELEAQLAHMEAEHTYLVTGEEA